MSEMGQDAAAIPIIGPFLAAGQQDSGIQALTASQNAQTAALMKEIQNTPTIQPSDNFLATKNSMLANIQNGLNDTIKTPGIMPLTGGSPLTPGMAARTG